MSSSISSSEPAELGSGQGQPDAARGWLKTFCATLAVSCALLYGFLILIDPFDSGRFQVLSIQGVSDKGPRTADASLGRDQRFDTAVFGNSTGQLLRPDRLSQATGLDVVQLTVPGTGPREQLALMHWFLRHHPKPAGLVLVADPTWCGQDASLPILFPFPFWLYSDNDVDYLAHLLSLRSIEHGVSRIQMALGLRQRSDPAGFCDCEGLDLHWRPRTDLPPLIKTQAQDPIDSSMRFPALERLEATLREEATTPLPLVIVMPPVFAISIPTPGTAQARQILSCKASFAQFAARRPMTRFLDFRVDGDTARDPANFLDDIHMRPIVARRVAHEVALAMNSIRHAQPSTKPGQDATEFVNQ